jgi:hypothetical protein
LIYFCPGLYWYYIKGRAESPQKRKEKKMATMAQAVEAIATATLEEAQQWEADPEQWINCMDFLSGKGLSVSADDRNADCIVNRLEIHFEAILAQESARVRGYSNYSEREAIEADAIENNK